MGKLTLRLSIVIGLGVFQFAPATASVLVDTFGPGNSSVGPGEAIFGDPLSPPGQAIANPFSVPAPMAVTDIIIADANPPGAIFSSLNLEIYADAGGLPANAPLWTGTIGCCGVIADSGLDIPLVAGNYWLALFSDGSIESQAAWLQSPSATGDLAFQNAFPVWKADVLNPNTPLSAYEIDASNIAEPGSLGILAAGMGTLALLRRSRKGKHRRKRQAR